MKFKLYLGLFVAAVLIGCAAAYLEKAPGYMDAEYYYGGGLRLAQGQGFTEPFLWNYLDDPAGIPHPSHTYWMPMASLVAAAGMLMSGQLNFNGARLFFILMAGLISPLTAYFAFRFSKKVAFGLLAGALAIFPGYYLAFIIDTETFTLYFILGALFMLVAFTESGWLSGKFALARPLLLGIIAGGMHLSRADGIVWLVAALALVVWESLIQFRTQTDIPKRRCILLAGGAILSLLAGYLLVMGSWYARNITLYGSLFSPGGAKTLWLLNYDQTFDYPASQLTWRAWAAQDLGSLINRWWGALLWNLKNALAVQGGIFLFLLILPGLWTLWLRKERIVRFALLMWVVNLGMMTFVFPFAGVLGGFFHSGSAIQPILWAAAPFGLDSFINLGVRLRHWNAKKSWPVFASGIVVMCVLFTVVIFWSRVIGSDVSQPAWSQSDRQYTAVTQALHELGAGPETRVLVNNPPGYNLASGGEALVIPNGDLATLLAVAKRYQADYLVLEPSHVTGLDSLYQHPGSLPGLVYLQNIWGTVYIYRVAIAPN